MLVRQRTTCRSVSLARSSFSIPRNAPRHALLNPYASAISRRLLVTQPDLLSWRRKPAQNPTRPGSQRPLATAVDDAMHLDDVPFQGLDSPFTTHHARPPSYLAPYELRSFDPTAPLQVKSQLTNFPRSRISAVTGIPGGGDELMHVFDACIQVNHLDRAALVLERFRDSNTLPDSELINLHNRYLRAAIDRAYEEPNSGWSQSLHTWYELHIRGSGLPQTSETIACMLKVSLISAHGSKLERLVNRYMDMMPKDSLFELAGEGVLSQQDFGTIASIYQPAAELYEELEDVSDSMDVAPSQDFEQITIGSSEAEAAPKFNPDEVSPMPQKGLGLKTLRGVLSFFEEIKGQDLSSLPKHQRREIQMRLERDCVDGAIRRWREEHQSLMKMGRNTALSTPALNSQIYDWHVTLEKKLEQELKLLAQSESRSRKAQEDIDRCIYGPFLRQSTPARLAAVTIMSVLNCLATNGSDKGIMISLVLTELAKKIEEDIKYQAKQRILAKRRAEYKLRRKLGTVAVSQAPAPSITGQAKATETDSSLVDPPTYDGDNWPILIKTKVGAALLSLLMDSAKLKVTREHPNTKKPISQHQPAFAHATVNRKGKRVGVLIPNKTLSNLMKSEPRGDFLARHLPMLVEPEPWTKFDKGGFVEYPSHLIRVKNGERDQRIYTEAAIARGDMDQAIKGLDVLGRTAWQINKPLYRVMLEAWNSGEPIANIPPLHPQIPIPTEPEPSEDPSRRREWLKRVKAVENEKSGLHSERCFMNFQLEIARAFQDQTFYFPHNMDFRGRAYPIPTYLNHMGADHTRGLLRFAKGKELGENGLRWLKVHTANVFGYDKASLAEREQFTMDHLDDIFESATNPLNGKRWWLTAEDKWQCLAACFELKAAFDSGDPTKHISHLPIHQDGTCNGLQHYAALGGDRWGAQQVNLEPGDRPADVYSAVADLVKKGIAEDLAADNFIAKAVDGKITRKVVKQTVMTNVYGVTFIGARAQVLKQLEAAYPHLESESGVPFMMLASYIASKIFKALSTMFRGAHDIQYWLGECAGRVCTAVTPEQIDQIANAGSKKFSKPRALQSSKPTKPTKDTQGAQPTFMSTIVWTTPLRMPVVQPYRRSSTRVIPTSLQDLTLQIPDRSDPVNRRKQLQGFPPNFIHSLDASHMLLSAIECDELGLSFAAVHDSFWTHAADVDVMNRVLRDSFIRIHSEDVVSRLASEFEARYKGSVYLVPVDTDAELAPMRKEIETLRKRRAKKITMADELVEEGERLRLLESKDPEEVQRGREMVTPGSIYAKYSALQPMTSTAEIDQIGLGNIPDTHATTQSAPVDLEEADEGDEEMDTDFSSAADEVEALKDSMSKADFEVKVTAKTTKAKSKTRSQVFLWLPLSFPPIPKKGDFDVTRLKDSQYFFS
ncbi:DNA-dependent RNA polymerase [Xylariaceae sp. FL0016]|nr:DNA-dependent RNA polymerase [Xylariaceae sp. FL0016]